MVRNDIYATFSGKEYPLTRYSNGDVWLYSYNISDLDNGFELCPPTRISVIDNVEYTVPIRDYQNRFIRKITKNDAIEIYRIETYGIYQGYEFRVYNDSDESRYLLRTDNYKVGEELGFERTDKYGHEKIVNKSEISHIFEDKKIIPNYFDR